MDRLSNYKNIQGWGADVDPKDRPAYPKEGHPPGGTGAHWDRPEQQVPRVRIFKSIERPEITRVFGTSTPPSGLSGTIRAAAYRLSESDLRHWLMLLFADRINVVEGIIADLSKGHVPNIFAEMGWKAEWKYNRPRAIAKIAIAAGIVSIAGFWLMSRRPKTEFYSAELYE